MAQKPVITKLGTVDCDLVEATPVVFQGRLYRFEYVRARYHTNTTGDSYFRFVDVETGEATPGFGAGLHLGSAHVEGDTVYAYGVNLWGGEVMRVLWSKDMQTWSEADALNLPGWAMYNNSVCKAGDRYIMAFEIGEPPERAGVRFTNCFAESKDLIHWTVMPEEYVYSKERYTACPVLRYFDGWFYMVYLETLEGPKYESYMVRTRDLKEWELSPLNPVMTFDDDDRQVASAKLTAEEIERINAAQNRNCSDFDMCEFKGKTFITYSWGNQVGVEFLAAAEYDGPMKAFCLGFYPES